MSGYLLDTNICIHFIKGEYNLDRKIEEVGFRSCYISEISIAELFYGAAKGAPEHKSNNLQRIHKLKNSFIGRILSISECLEGFAEQKAHLRRTGKIVADLDIFLGATAIVNDLTFATRNVKDFINMNGIRLENWIDTE